MAEKVRKALVIGINKYPKLGTLRKAGRDAEAIARMLEIGGFEVTRLPEMDQGGAKQIDETKLLGENTLRTEIKKLFHPTKEQDVGTALLFFSGHGYEGGRKKKGYLAASDTDTQKWLGIPFDWLLTELINSSVQEQIIWLDCCHSGGFTNLVFDQAPRKQSNKSSPDRQFITACRQFEQAEGVGKHGVLTQLLLQELNPHGYPLGREITSTSLDISIRRALAQNEALITRIQRPVIKIYGGAIIYWTTRAKIEESEQPKKFFIGREKDIAKLDAFVREGRKIIVIQADGGVGKTNLAEHYLNPQKFDLILELRMARKPQDIIPVERVLKDWLEEHFNFNKNQVPEFSGMLRILERKLKENSKKIGVLIDNLEPALDGQGKFVLEHRRYVDLLLVLGQQTVRSLTIITTRERVYEASVDLKPYVLKGLSVETWEEFFKYNQIKTDFVILSEMHKAYGGNAKAMEIISSAIQNDSEGDLNQYWQANGKDLLNKDLKNLVSVQFDRLKELHLDSAYQLLCRLGCYRYQQDSPSLGMDGVLCLLWDTAETQRIQVVDTLRDCSLLELKNGQYFLHPMIGTEASKRLNSSSENKEVNIKVAEFYTRQANKFDSPTEIKAAFESIEHFFIAEQFESCHNVLLQILEAEKNLENLRCSENLWSYTRQIIKVCEKLSSKLTGFEKALTLIPLGVLYPEIGKNTEANKVSEEIFKITNEIKKDNEKDETIIFAEISAYLVSGRANKFIGNFPDALQACENASKLAKNAIKKVEPSKINYWRGLALYELGTVHLEKSRTEESSAIEAGKALRCIVAAAFLAGTNLQQIPTDIYSILITPIENLPDKLNQIINRYSVDKPRTSRDDDYTKKFRILFNVGRCFNSMKLYKLAEIVLNLALNILDNKNDNLNETWSYLELGLCYSTRDQIKAEEYYGKALELSLEVLSMCRAFTLSGYGNFNYEQGLYKEALTKYKDLEVCLEETKTELKFLKARNYFNIYITYLKIPAAQRNESISFIDLNEYLEKSEEICQELKLPLLEKVREQRRNLINGIKLN